MNRIIDLKFQQGYTVWLRFKDGFEGLINIKQFLGEGIATELLEIDKFKTLKIESGGGLVWFNGYDICPNYLRELMKNKDH